MAFTTATALSVPVLSRRASSSPQITVGGAAVWKCRRLWSGSQRLEWNWRRMGWQFVIRASNGGSSDSSESSVIPVVKNQPESYQRSFNSLKETVHVLVPVVTLVKTRLCSKFAMMVCAAFAIFIIIVRKAMPKRQNHVSQGSIAELVKRGQLKSNRRGIAKTSLYDNPFNNAFVKIDEETSTAQMFGKKYRLAPATLTKEQKLTHQERRARAYQWKRPKVFLKEGDPIPPDVDPDSVRWIPPNHPFASTSSDINEETFRNNVYQKDGVPFRIRAEHEAMQKKLEALQEEPKLKELAVNLKNPEKFEEPSQPQTELKETKKGDDRINKGLKSSDEKS